MGLLDDAIREHLELKRKHGAADDELRRQESEALGPARRDFAGPAPAEETAAEAVEEPVEPLPSDDAEGEYEDVAAEPTAWLEDEPGGAPFEHEVDPEPVRRVAEAAPPVPAQDPLPAQSDTPTQDFPAVSRDDAPEDEEEGEDVLEETPDFLQDTPEHDRLWFEQKPPRDFDFDG